MPKMLRWGIIDHESKIVRGYVYAPTEKQALRTFTGKRPLVERNDFKQPTGRLFGETEQGLVVARMCRAEYKQPDSIVADEQPQEVHDEAC